MGTQASKYDTADGDTGNNTTVNHNYPPEAEAEPEPETEAVE